MALDKGGLTEALTAIFEDLDESKTAEQKATEMADAIDAFVKTGDVDTSGTTIQACTAGGASGSCSSSGSIT